VQVIGSLRFKTGCGSSRSTEAALLRAAFFCQSFWQVAHRLRASVLLKRKFHERAAIKFVLETAAPCPFTGTLASKRNSSAQQDKAVLFDGSRKFTGADWRHTIDRFLG